MSSEKKKFTQEEDDEVDERSAKAKKHDIQPPECADVDIKLAEKLDSLLNISSTRKLKFSTNKPKSSPSRDSPDPKQDDRPAASRISSSISTKLKARNLTSEELKQRLITRYETLVPELDPERANVKVVKILSATESMKLGRDQAKKQMDQQMALNSVAGNQNAHLCGTESFKFCDGYEMPNDDSKGRSLKNVVAGAGSGSKLLAQKSHQIAEWKNRKV